MKKAIISSIILVGFIAMSSQIVLVRELLVVFYGNELSVAFILAGWLIAGAIGSALWADSPTVYGQRPLRFPAACFAWRRSFP